MLIITLVLCYLFLSRYVVPRANCRHYGVYLTNVEIQITMDASTNIKHASNVSWINNLRKLSRFNKQRFKNGYIQVPSLNTWLHSYPLTITHFPIYSYQIKYFKNTKPHTNIRIYIERILNPFAFHIKYM